MERTHGKSQAGRDLTKSLECPPADSRGSCGVRTVCLGLDSIMSVQAPSFSNLSGQPVLLLESPHSGNAFMGFSSLDAWCVHLC